MNVSVDPGSALPPYEQIRGQLTELISAGVLSEGARLPTIRQLAGDLGLAPGTVARAYRELEAEGAVVSRVRHGTVVARPRRPSAKQAGDRLAAAARTYAVTVASLGLKREDAIAELDRQLAELVGT